MLSRSSDEVPKRINILTLNCWGLKFLSKYRRERLSEIGRQLASSEHPPDVVGLQECWTQEDFESIRKHTRQILPYSKFYFSGIFGSGLAIFSKWPIEESSMFEYPLNGRPTAFFRGDWFVGKGVACARIRIGPGPNDIAEVFCTHLHAPYEKEPRDSYLCHRTAQAWEIAKLMRGAAERGHLVIGLGDFNMLPLSFAHRLIAAHAPVQDVWRYLHPESSIGAAVDAVEEARRRPVPSANFNIIENGATCDGIFNTWRWSPAQRKRFRSGETYIVDGQLPDPLAKRLDYIFVGDGGFARSVSPWKWTIKSARVSMTEPHPKLRCSLSDHFAVEATIEREIPEEDPEEENIPFLPIQKHIDHPHLRIPSVNKLRSTKSTPPTPALTADIYDQILTIIANYVARERFQRRARLCHFLASLFISIGCLASIWWSNRSVVSFILCLVSTLSFAAGVIDGLIGGLFVSSELRALKEFEWEVRNAKRMALGLGLDIEEDLGLPAIQSWYSQS